MSNIWSPRKANKILIRFLQLNNTINPTKIHPFLTEISCCQWNKEEILKELTQNKLNPNNVSSHVAARVNSLKPRLHTTPICYTHPIYHTHRPRLHTTPMCYAHSTILVPKFNSWYQNGLLRILVSKYFPLEREGIWNNLWNNYY